MKKKISIMELTGTWSDITQERADRMKRGIKNLKRGARLKELIDRWTEK
jgi:hypothetical protein